MATAQTDLPLCRMHLRYIALPWSKSEIQYVQEPHEKLIHKFNIKKLRNVFYK